jgi:predicted transcriptional regulator
MATSTFRLENDLKTAFADLAESQERTSAQLLRVLMKQAIERSLDEQEHDGWFRDEVEQAVHESDDPSVQRIPHGQVRSSWRRQRAELQRRAAGRPA